MSLGNNISYFSLGLNKVAFYKHKCYGANCSTNYSANYSTANYSIANYNSADSVDSVDRFDSVGSVES